MKILFILLALTANGLFASVDIKKITDEYFTQKIKNLNTPGLILAVVKDGKIAHYRTYGQRNIEKQLPVTKDTLFRIGSLTKTFTGTAVMILRDQKVINLDDPVENHIPELRSINYPYKNSPLISIRHLATHTSGLVRNPMPWEIDINGLIDQTLNPINSGSTFVPEFDSYFYPGYKYQYSNLGVSLLGEMVTRKAGVDVKEYITKEIFAKLGMSNSFWHEDDVPEDQRSYAYNFVNNKWQKNKDWNLQGYAAAGSMYSTIGDLAKWMNLQFHSKPESGPKILNPFTLAEMHKVQVYESANSNSRGTGIIWSTVPVNDLIQVGHNGGTAGYRTNFGFDKNHNVGVIAMASNSEVDVDTLGENLLYKLQVEFYREMSLSFMPIVQKLLPYLQLVKQVDYTSIFDNDLYSAFSNDSGWVNILTKIENKYGKVLGLEKVQAYSKHQANVKLKTSKGILAYIITFSGSEKGKLSGIKTNGFEESK